MDNVRVGIDCVKPDHCNLFSVWSAVRVTTFDLHFPADVFCAFSDAIKYLAQARSALGVVLSKDPSLLTVEDALVIACSCSPYLVQWSTNSACDQIAAAVGYSPATDFIGVWVNANFMVTVRTPRDDMHHVLMPLLLELLKAPEKLEEYTLVGVLAALAWGVAGRPAVVRQVLLHKPHPPE